MNNELRYIPPEEVTELDLVDVAFCYLLEEIEKLTLEEKAAYIPNMVEFLQEIGTKANNEWFDQEERRLDEEEQS